MNVTGHSVFFGYDNPLKAQLGVTLEERFRWCSPVFLNLSETAAR